MKIITKEAIHIKPNFDYDELADIKNITGFQKKIQTLNKSKEIKIYDKGIIFGSDKEVLEVSDHINKTGMNAIIHNLKIEFKDISKIYEEKHGIITTCCGKYLNEKHLNPSHYLCVFSVLLLYMGYRNIRGFIINERSIKRTQ